MARRVVAPELFADREARAAFTGAVTRDGWNTTGIKPYCCGFWPTRAVAMSFGT